MNGRIRACAAFALMGLLALPGLLGAEFATQRTYILFNGENRSASSQDTSEYASAWISVKGAKRIVIRTWSAGAAADTAYNDSITTFKVLFSDSVCCMVTGPYGQTVQSAADSVMIDAALSTPYDTTKISIRVDQPLPINKALKASANGSGILTPVSPVTPGLVTLDATTGSVISKSYMRVRCLPKIRFTTAGFSSTAGIRTAGVRALKMVATVYYGVK